MEQSNKDLKTKLLAYQHLYNGIKLKHSMGRLKTWSQFYSAIGQSTGEQEYAHSKEHLITIPTWAELRKSLECIKIKIEQQSTIPNYDSTIKDHEYEGIKFPDKLMEVSGETSKRESQSNEQLSQDLSVCTEQIELPYSEKEKATLFYFQKKATAELLVNSDVKKLPCQLLLCAAGFGKTFMIGAHIRRQLDSGVTVGKNFSPWPIIVVTKASIVIQTERVLKEFFGIDTVNEVIVINIEQLRSAFGRMFVKEQVQIINGEEIVKFEWKKNIFPIRMYLDECQGVKNTDSIQSQIFQSYNEIPAPYIHQVYFSATPFTKVSEAKCFVVACKLKSRFGGDAFGREVLITNENWNTFAINIAHPAKPTEHSPKSVERLMKELLPYIVDVKGVRSQFHAINIVEILEFETVEDRAFYESAMERWEKDKARFESIAKTTGHGQGMCILAAFTKFRQAAELCKATLLARRAHNKILEGYAPVIAACFKTTIVRIVQLMCSKYGYKRSDISLIWGGKSEGKSKALKKKELRDKLAGHADFLEELQKMGASLEELGLTSSDIAELIDEESEKLNKELIGNDLQLGSQNKKQRQVEIDNFQSQKTLMCIFTFKAGGVGLSTHHSDEQTVQKVRRKKDSNWAYEDDIPSISTRSRSTDLTPVYSAIELVQGLGRCPRLTSLSNTPQSLLFFKNTIEEEVAHSVSMKLRCLKKIVRMKEQMSWESVIIGGYNKKLDQDLAKFAEAGDSADDYLTGGGDLEDEDEDE